MKLINLENKKNIFKTFLNFNLIMISFKKNILNYKAST